MRPAPAATLRPPSLVAAAALLVALGAGLLPRLPIAAYPRPGGPRLTVEVTLPSAGRDELVATVVAPLERELAAVPEVRGVDSFTTDGGARLVVRGGGSPRRGSRDGERLRLLVERRLGDLGVPLGATRIELAPADARPLLEVAVLGGDAAARAAFARGVAVPALARAAGAERVDMLGATPLRAVVEPRAAALAARGLTAADLAARLRRLGATVAVGRVRQGAVARPLVVGETIASLGELRQLRIATAGGAAVLADVASVTLQPLGDGGAYRLDGAPGVLLRLFAPRDGNALRAGVELRRTVRSLAAQAPAGLKLRVVAGGADREWLAVAALTAATLGAALAMVALWRRRGSGWVTALAAAAALPAALLAAVVPLALVGWPLDPVALATLATAVGLAGWPLAAAATPRLVGGEAVPPRLSPEVDGGATFQRLGSALLPAAAWAPLGLVGGSALALAGGPLLAVGAFAAMTLAYARAAQAAGAMPEVRVAPAPDAMADAPGASPVVRRSRRRWWWALGASAMVAFAALAVGGALRGAVRALAPSASTPQVVVAYQLEPELSAAARAARGARWALEIAAALPAPRPSMSWMQPPSRSDGDVAPAALRLTFTDVGQAARATAALQRRLDEAAGVRGSVAARTEAWFAGDGDVAPFELWAIAPTDEGSAALAARVTALLRAGGVAARASSSRASEWRVAPLPRAAGHPFGDDVTSALGDFDAGTVGIPGVEPGIRLRAPGAAGDPRLLPVRAGAEGGVGAVVPLAAVASVRRSAAPPVAVRHDGRPATRLELTARGEGRLPVVAAAVAATPTGPGERLELASTPGALVEARRGLRLATMLGALLVLAALFAVVPSPVSALLAFVPLPCAVGGAILGALALSAGRAGAVVVTLGVLLSIAFAAVPSALVCADADRRRGRGARAREAIRAARDEGSLPLLGWLLAIAASVSAALLVVGGAALPSGMGGAVLGGAAAAMAAAGLLVPHLYARWHGRSEPRRDGPSARGGKGPAPVAQRT